MPCVFAPSHTYCVWWTATDGTRQQSASFTTWVDAEIFRRALVGAIASQVSNY